MWGKERGRCCLGIRREQELLDGGWGIDELVYP